MTNVFLNTFTLVANRYDRVYRSSAHSTEGIILYPGVGVSGVNFWLKFFIKIFLGGNGLPDPLHMCMSHHGSCPCVGEMGPNEEHNTRLTNFIKIFPVCIYARTLLPKSVHICKI